MQNQGIAKAKLIPWENSVGSLGQQFSMTSNHANVNDRAETLLCGPGDSVRGSGAWTQLTAVKVDVGISATYHGPGTMYLSGKGAQCSSH